MLLMRLIMVLRLIIIRSVCLFPPFYCALSDVNTGKSGLRAVLQALASLPCLCGSGERFVA